MAVIQNEEKKAAIQREKDVSRDFQSYMTDMIKKERNGG